MTEPVEYKRNIVAEETLKCSARAYKAVLKVQREYQDRGEKKPSHQSIVEAGSGSF